METSGLFIEFIQSCITPVALISGIGLLLLTVANRLGRTIDRTRYLVADLDQKEVKRREFKINEITILLKRGTYLRNSIQFIVISIILSCLMIPLLFIMHLSNIDLRLVGYGLFILSFLAIFVSCIYFYLDIKLSLTALKLEAADYVNKKVKV